MRREDEIAALLIGASTSKLMVKRLDISPHTADVCRARLIPKNGAATEPDLVHKLLAG